MHDWTLVSLTLDWSLAQLVIQFRKTGSESAALIARGVSEVRVPQKNEWGRSVSVNEVHGPSSCGASEKRIEIEMQSGDVISITAKSFEIPH